MHDAALEHQLDRQLVAAELAGPHLRRPVLHGDVQRVLIDIVREQTKRLALIAVPRPRIGRRRQVIEGNRLADAVALAADAASDGAGPGIAERRRRWELAGGGAPAALVRHRPVAAAVLPFDILKIAERRLADPHQLDVNRAVREGEQRPPVDVIADHLAIRQRRVGRRQLEAAEQERHLRPVLRRIALAGDRVGWRVVTLVLGDFRRRRRQEGVQQQGAADRDDRASAGSESTGGHRRHCARRNQRSQ